MPNTFIFAGAGSGKTERVVSDSIKLIDVGMRVLVLTYTINNQQELEQRFARNNCGSAPSFTVKGLYTFYLEEIIRPYQRVLFTKRIERLNFNEFDPHKRNGKYIYGRGEIVNGKYNPLHYLTADGSGAHSMYLAKLACAIIKETGGLPIRRLEAIYDQLYFDECQDMVGWDYEVLSWLSKSTMSITCVGDFRQTIYETAQTTKSPGTNVQKLDYLKKLKFNEEPMNVSYRCAQPICDYAGQLHARDGFVGLKSEAELPTEFADHVGVFLVKETDARRYFNKYAPVLLRHGVSSGTEYDDTALRKVTFGKSKGLGFPRIAIIPTAPHLKFLQGKANAFGMGKTDETRNKFYVALTRARYSVALIVPDKLAAKCNLPLWPPTI